MPKAVPNEQPTISHPDYRLAIVGEAPGEKEELMEKPFVGASGQLLQGVMSAHGLMRSACLIANCVQYRPPANEIKAFAIDGPEFLHGISKLHEDIQQFNPHCILLLGATPLRLAGVSFNVSSFRGTIFRCSETTSPFYGFKCVSTLHPAFILRSYDTLELFSFDVGRAKEEAKSPELNLPNRTFYVELTAEQIIQRLDSIQEDVLTSVDIEGGIEQGITCIGISTSPSEAFIVNHNDFSDSERVRILRSLGRVLGNDRIPKVLQNSLYDNFCLSWKLKIPIRGVVHDTMLSGWELFPELKKGLGTQTSIWTREPFYKFQRKINDKLTHYTYCCRDAAVTMEIHKAQIQHIKGSSLQHYQHSIELLSPIMYMQLRGFRYDKTLADSRCAEIIVQMNELSARMEASAGVFVNPNCNSGANSIANILYKKMGFEPQFQKVHGRKTAKYTANVDALLTLTRSYKESILFDILRWRALEGQRKQLMMLTDPDGRVRCSYNQLSKSDSGDDESGGPTDTGRMSCAESNTGSGTNLQTIMKVHRDLFLADPGMVMFQSDLSGADGWTVAAHCNRLGDDTMLLDYLCPGFKPAKWLALVHQDNGKAALPRADLLPLMKTIKSDDWIYPTCKMVQHGSNYMMKGRTMSSNIQTRTWKDSGKPIYVTPKECENLQSLYFNLRYRGVYHWHHYVKETITKTKQLACASGHVRTFFRRPGDLETLKAALSHEPQANTTYATNLALHRLWHDPDNRGSDGRLIIEPLHQVHDALIGQFPEDKISWAQEKIRSYFNNPLSIAEQQITIPFDGRYGEHWYACGDEKNERKI